MAKAAASKKKVIKKKTVKKTATKTSPPPAAPAAPVAPTATSVSPVPPPKSTITNAIDDPSVSLQRFDLLDLPLFDSAALSALPHNACSDAAALRDYVLAQEGRMAPASCQT